MSKPRLRFAPSPTGFLHIGSMRTVLFDYLIAKQLNADFILRIEDTDEKREVEGATEALLKTLDLIGIKFNEGYGHGGEYGPYIQSERQEIYDKYKEVILQTGQAYKCFCTPERLEQMRAKQTAEKQAPRYDRACRDLSETEVEKRIKAGEKYVIRQKMPLTGDVVVKDELRGEIKFPAEDIEDQVLIKSNGVPTYQFANVVDDHEMKITHVTRSEEWLPSLPKNVLLYQAFGWEAPIYIHFAGVLNKDGGKLSKRQGDVMVEDFLSKGYLKEALINFCALLGWHPSASAPLSGASADKKDEIYSLNELEKIFDYKDIKTSGAIFDTEKLDYFNGYYIRQMDLEDLTNRCKPFLDIKNEAKYNDVYLKKVVGLEQERLKKLSDIKEATEYFFVDELNFDPSLLIWKKLTAEDVKKNLEIIHEVLARIPQDNWTNDSIEEACISHIQAVGGKNGDFLWPLRVSLTGRQASPSPFDVAEVLGKDNSLDKIKKAIKIL